MTPVNQKEIINRDAFLKRDIRDSALRRSEADHKTHGR
jgi:hypothetical protein